MTTTTGAVAIEDRVSLPEDRKALCRCLDNELVDIARQQSELDVRQARCIRRIEQTEVWRDLGFPSLMQYLEARLGCAPRTALDRLRVARALGELPLVEAALANNEISHSAARELARVATAKTEAAWIDRARGKSLRVIEDLVRGHRKGALPDDPKQPDLEPRTLTFEVTTATYALLRQAMTVLAEETGHRLDDDELVATLARRALDTSTADRASGNSANEPPPQARYQIGVVICEHCRRGWQQGGGAMIEIDRAAMDVAECDAQRLGSLDAQHPERATQDITPATRRLVWLRDGGCCRVEGCRSARNIDLHHLQHRADGGGHDAWNLALLCSGCHLALHRGHIEVIGCGPNAVLMRKAERQVVTNDNVAPADQRERQPHVNDRHDRHGAMAHANAKTALAAPSGASKLAAAVLRMQARQALITSGFRKHEASAAVDAAIAHVGAESTLEQLLVEALRRCKPQ